MSKALQESDARSRLAASEADVERLRTDYEELCVLDR
jgi:hypothetical protein